MFDVYCPRHAARLVLFTDDIEALVNGPDGVELHWQCSCGHRGVTPFPSPEPVAGACP